MFGSKGEFEKHDGGGAFEVVDNHPPERALVENSVVRFFRDELKDGPGRGDASVCGDMVEVVGGG